jgi:hypothetical protein
MKILFIVVLVLGQLGCAISFAPSAILSAFPSPISVVSKASVSSFSLAQRSNFAARVRHSEVSRRLTVDQSELNERIAQFYDDR